MRSFAFAIGTTCLALHLLGCGTASNVTLSDLTDLRAQHERERARLGAIRTEIAEAERRAAAAREEAEFQQCRSGVAGIKADVAVVRSACAQSNAEFHGCAAKNEAHTSRWGVGGCLFGIGAALLTGGAAAPLGLGGCAGGLMTGSATEEDCGAAPSCSSDEQALLATALSQRQLGALPLCGGYAGLAVQPYSGALATGLLVEQIGVNTTAQSAGLRVNDLVFTINGMRIADPAALARALAAVPVGAPIALDIVRDGATVRVVGVARDVAATGARSVGTALGVAFEWRALGAFAGSAVAGMDPTGPAARAGLLPGDVIFRVDATPVRTADDIALALAEKRGGAVAIVSLFRAGAPAMALLTLDSRRGRTGL